MLENSWQFVGNTRRDTDQKGFVHVYLGKVSFLCSRGFVGGMAIACLND